VIEPAVMRIPDRILALAEQLPEPSEPPDRSVPWKQRQQLPCLVDPDCTVDHLRRRRGKR
jgi:hypothetical protein